MLSSLTNTCVCMNTLFCIHVCLYTHKKFIFYYHWKPLYIQFYFHSFSLKIISSCFVMQLEMIMIIIFNSCIIFLACLGYKKNSKHIEKLLVQSSSLWSKWCSSQSCRQVYSSWGTNGDSSQSKAGHSVRFLLGVILVQSRNFELFQQLVGNLAQLTKLTEEPNNVLLRDPMLFSHLSLWRILVNTSRVLNFERGIWLSMNAKWWDQN